MNLDGAYLRAGDLSKQKPRRCQGSFFIRKSHRVPDAALVAARPAAVETVAGRRDGALEVQVAQRAVELGFLAEDEPARAFGPAVARGAIGPADETAALRGFEVADG